MRETATPHTKAPGCHHATESLLRNTSSLSGRRRHLLHRPVISLAESLAIIIPRRRRHRRIAETLVRLGIRRTPMRNIVPRRAESIIKGLLRNLPIRRWRRRRRPIAISVIRMPTACKSNRCSQCTKQKSLLHSQTSVISGPPFLQHDLS